MSNDDRVDKLSSRADTLTDIVRKLIRGQRVNRWHKIVLATAVALDVVLTIVIASIASNQSDLTRQLRRALTQNYTTSQQQLQTRTDFLCPLYQLFIGLADDPTRQAELTPAQREQSGRASVELHKQYSRLHCPAPPSP